MSKISIPFNDWSKDKLRKKMKTCTTRTKLYGKSGDFFKIGLQDYRLEATLRTRLHIVASQFWKEEGADSPDDFIAQWCLIHPLNKWEPDKWVWMHFFYEYTPAHH